MRRYGLTGTLIAALVALAMLWAGCGGSDDGNGDSGEASAGDSEAAAEVVKKATATPEFISPGDPIDLSSIKGEEVWLIGSDLSIPFEKLVSEGFADAADTAGLNAVLFDGKGDTAEWSKGIDRAVAADASGIVLYGVAPKFVPEALKKAQAADIPVAGMLNVGAGEELPASSAGEASIDFKEAGMQMAAYIADSTDGDVKALYADVPEFEILGGTKAGLEEGLEEYCGSRCELETYDLQLASAQAEGKSRTAAELRKHPDTNWIISSYDGLALTVIPAVKEAGLEDQVSVISQNAVAANLKFVQEGDVQVADVGNSNAWLGWAGLDRIARAMLGEEPAFSEVPLRLFTRENLEGVDPNDESELFGEVDFRAEYEDLWK